MMCSRWCAWSWLWHTRAGHHAECAVLCSDREYFGGSSRPLREYSDNWAVRFNSLKRLFRLMTGYYADVLHQPTTAIDVPNLQAIAQDFDLNESLIMCRLAIALAVQSEKNQSIIERIRKLADPDQHALMHAIEQVRTACIRCKYISHILVGDVEIHGGSCSQRREHD